MRNPDLILDLNSSFFYSFHYSFRRLIKINFKLSFFVRLSVIILDAEMEFFGQSKVSGPGN